MESSCVTHPFNKYLASYRTQLISGSVHLLLNIRWKTLAKSSISLYFRVAMKIPLPAVLWSAFIIGDFVYVILRVDFLTTDRSCDLTKALLICSPIYQCETSSYVRYVPVRVFNQQFLPDQSYITKVCQNVVFKLILHVKIIIYPFYLTGATFL